jgi:hypothetical protein
MIFTHDQLVILDLFGATLSFYFFYNITITVLLFESKQLESLVHGLYGNFNFVMNNWIMHVPLLCKFVSLGFRGLIVIF